MKGYIITKESQTVFNFYNRITKTWDQYFSETETLYKTIT